MKTVETSPCPVCGEKSTVTVPSDGYEKWRGGMFIQRALPDLHPTTRELLMTGTHGVCWDALFPEEDE